MVFPGFHVVQFFCADNLKGPSENEEVVVWVLKHYCIARSFKSPMIRQK